MGAVIAVLIVIAVLVAIGLYLRSRGGGISQRSLAGAISTQAAALSEVAFNVDGSTAHVHFDTEIPAEGADEVLAALMGREARRVFDSKSESLPLAGVKRVKAHGKHGDRSVEVTTIDLTVPSDMHEVHETRAGDVVHASEVEAFSDDPLGQLHAMEFGRSGGYRGGTDELPPLADDLQIPAKVLESVAGPDGTISGISLQNFIAGLLRTAGYEVQVSGDGTGTARKGGTTTFVQFVDHAAGSHPELDEGSVDAFVMKFMSSGADRGMLFTPKFGPYAIYEKERRNDRVKYMTRERLQAFVDSVAMG